MSFFTRTKLAISSIRNLTSKPITQRHSSFQQINHYITSNFPGKTPKPPFSPFSSMFPSSRNPNFRTLTTRRTYYVDRNQIQHFRPRGPAKWFQNPKNLLIVIIIGTGITISIYYGNIETIPYTKRNHFILVSTRMEKQMGEMQFQNLKKSLKGKILPGIHPESVRVKLIAREIIEALQRGIKQETVWSDPSYSSESSGVSEESAQETMKALTEEVVGKGERESWLKDEEVLDDKWVQKSQKKAKERGLQPATSHLDGLHWEVIVVDEPVVNAFCLPGGKIVVFTGLLQHFQTDAEIATIIGHEVAHAVARHSAEGITKNMWVAIVQIVLLQFFYMPDVVSAMSNLLLNLPFSRRMEMEADYIGLLLLASAGYNPRVAPKVYEKLGKLGGESPLRDYLSTHPSGKKRARLLADAKVMEEAMTIYKEVRAGRLIQDFL